MPKLHFYEPQEFADWQFLIMVNFSQKITVYKSEKWRTKWHSKTVDLCDIRILKHYYRRLIKVSFPCSLNQKLQQPLAEMTFLNSSIVDLRVIYFEAIQGDFRQTLDFRF